MFRNALTSCYCFCSTSYVTIGFLVAVAALVVGGLDASVFAQTEQQIVLVPPNINWMTLPEKFMEIILPPLLVGIAVGFSIWAVIMGVKFIRQAAK